MGKAWIGWILLFLILGIALWGWSSISFAVVDRASSQENWLVFKYLKLGSPGYIVVNGSQRGFPHEQIGISDLAVPGLYRNIWVEMYEKSDPSLSPYLVKAGSRFYIRLYHDTSGDQLPRTEDDTLIREYTVDF